MVKSHCPLCSRGLPDLNALYQHVRARHGKREARRFKPPDTSEPSMADLVVEAIEARAAGEPVDPVIAEMFDLHQEYPHG